MKAETLFELLKKHDVAIAGYRDFNECPGHLQRSIIALAAELASTPAPALTADELWRENQIAGNYSKVVPFDELYESSKIYWNNLVARLNLLLQSKSRPVEANAVCQKCERLEKELGQVHQDLSAASSRMHSAELHKSRADEMVEFLKKKQVQTSESFDNAYSQAITGRVLISSVLHDNPWIKEVALQCFNSAKTVEAKDEAEWEYYEINTVVIEAGDDLEILNQWQRAPKFWIGCDNLKHRIRRPKKPSTAATRVGWDEFPAGTIICIGDEEYAGDSQWCRVPSESIGTRSARKIRRRKPPAASAEGGTPTPETDAAAWILNCGPDGNGTPRYVVDSQFMAIMERQRNEAREKLAVCRKIIRDTAIIVDPECPDAGAYEDGHCGLAEVTKRKLSEARERVKQCDLRLMEVHQQWSDRLKEESAKLEASHRAHAETQAKFEKAERSLLTAGFQDLGGTAWKPPLGPVPDFIKIERLQEQLAETTLELARLKADNQAIDLKQTQLSLELAGALKEVEKWKEILDKGNIDARITKAELSTAKATITRLESERDIAQERNVQWQVKYQNDLDTWVQQSTEFRDELSALRSAGGRLTVEIVRETAYAMGILEAFPKGSIENLVIALNSRLTSPWRSVATDPPTNKEKGKFVFWGAEYEDLGTGISSGDWSMKASRDTHYMEVVPPLPAPPEDDEAQEAWYLHKEKMEYKSPMPEARLEFIAGFNAARAQGGGK